jgi:hypothetical protein
MLLIDGSGWPAVVHMVLPVPSETVRLPPFEDVPWSVRVQGKAPLFQVPLPHTA